MRSAARKRRGIEEKSGTYPMTESAGIL